MVSKRVEGWTGRSASSFAVFVTTQQRELTIDFGISGGNVRGMASQGEPPGCLLKTWRARDIRMPLPIVRR
jgi:hypothetical protein